MNSYSEPSARYLTLRDEALHDLLGHIDRDCESDTHITAGLRNDRGIDAHHFALKVYQGAAAVARIDSGISLDEVLILTSTGEGAPFRGNDSCRNRIIEAETCAGGHDPLTDLKLVGISELRRFRQAFFDFYLNHGEIGARVASDYLRLHGLLVAEPNRYFISISDDVVVREDVSLLVNDYSCTQSTLRSGNHLVHEVFA